MKYNRQNYRQVKKQILGTITMGNRNATRVEE